MHQAALVLHEVDFTVPWSSRADPVPGRVIWSIHEAVLQNTSKRGPQPQESKKSNYMTVQADSGIWLGSSTVLIGWTETILA